MMATKQEQWKINQRAGFAAKAMQGLLSVSTEEQWRQPEDFAIIAVAMADALIARLEERAA